MRILIVKLTAIGDVVHAMPVACALREHMPDAVIGWVVEGHTGDLLRGHEAIDEVFAAPRHWLHRPGSVLALRRRLRAFAPDVTLDLQGLTKSAVAAWLSGASRRIGFAGNISVDWGRWFNNDLFQLTVGREMSRWINNELVEITAEHIVDRYLQLVEPLGIDSPRVRFNIPQCDEDALAAERLADELSLSGGYAVVNPGAGKRSKLWCADRFAAVSRHLGVSHGLAVLVVWAGDRERRWADQIAAGAPDCAVVAPPTSLGLLAAVARRARIFVAGDTGPLHIAAAVGTPCVGLFGTMPARRNRPYGPGHVTVQKGQLCGTSVQRHRAGNEAMLAITAEMVCRACDEILARPRRPA